MEDEFVLSALDSLLTVLSSLETQLSSSESLQQIASDSIPDTTNASEFWITFNGIIQMISKESTKFTMAFSEKPLPEGDAGVGLCKALERPVMGLAALYYSALPTASGVFGKLCWHEVNKACVEVFQALKKMVCAAKSGQKQALQLQNTGTVWELCDRIVSNQFPRDNRLAFLSKVSELMPIINDAISELQQSKKEGSDDSESRLCASCVNLSKTAKAAVQKARQAVANRHNGSSAALNSDSAAELDNLADCLDKLSPALDDLAAAFYLCQEVWEEGEDSLPSHLVDEVESEAESVSGTVCAVLDAFKASAWWYVENDDLERVEFVRTAAEHNLTKLREVTKNL